MEIDLYLLTSETHSTIARCLHPRPKKALRSPANKFLFLLMSDSREFIFRFLHNSHSQMIAVGLKRVAYVRTYAHSHVHFGLAPGLHACINTVFHIRSLYVCIRLSRGALELNTLSMRPRIFLFHPLVIHTSTWIS